MTQITSLVQEGTETHCIIASHMKGLVYHNYEFSISLTQYHITLHFILLGTSIITWHFVLLSISFTADFIMT